MTKILIFFFLFYFLVSSDDWNLQICSPTCTKCIPSIALTVVLVQLCDGLDQEILRVWRSPRGHAGQFLAPCRATQNHSFECCLSFSHAKSLYLGQNVCVSLWEEFMMWMHLTHSRMLHSFNRTMLPFLPFNLQFLTSQAYSLLSKCDLWKQLTRTACLNNNKTKTFQNFPEQNEYMRHIRDLLRLLT